MKKNVAMHEVGRRGIGIVMCLLTILLVGSFFYHAGSDWNKTKPIGIVKK